MKRTILQYAAMISVFILMAGTFTAVVAGTEARLEAQRTSSGIVVIGHGFEKFESVDLVLESLTAGNTKGMPVGEWSVIANASGGIETEFSESLLSVWSNGIRIHARGVESKTAASLLLAPSADLDQCANGTFAVPVQCTGANWQNGNVGSSNGHYYEGDSIPYRIVFSDLTVGATNTVTVEWDTTQGGKHAIDYITSYDRTENVGNNPCSGVVPACGAVSTFPIPLDPNVGSAGVTQIPGQVFTMWGATITSVSAYTLSGSYAGNSATRVTVSFTANQANPVLAWSGHIAERVDWALMGGSASDINGSPYHTRLIDLNGSGGNQDRSLSTSGVRLNSQITIVKQALPESALGFGFTVSGTGISPFTLWDDGVDNDATPNNVSFRGLLAPGGSGTFTITEGTGFGFYSLTALSCTGSTGATSLFTTSVPSRLASITLQYGDTVTCTFTNAVTTAASVSAEGRVTTENGTGISRATVSITNTSTGETQTQLTGSFGVFRFDGLEAGSIYVLNVGHKRYRFLNDTITFTLNDSVRDLHFSAAP